ncbi:STE/STE11/BCK1 protein kinase [Allomyces macrogynus ATCC 38327]|uniref:STE/STE11/BCK1 protein kinase n=1 Tax=Allomyces macrogynus (strain ATCC 38327) TaxID=578462 RepID=A0A0L0RVT4_ALLM3|nr:STE/STE11/BCK1 protein kinase [Allomyces macrogynus ATCC 38327]|eukprot:KNE54423.1 STE/STE11/BCK1 protein kinase [Allomyces macrogynus ATCC 38327]
MDVAQWTPAQVDHWLASNKLEYFRDVFRAYQVTGYTLLHLDGTTLAEHFRLDSFAERARFAKAQKQLIEYQREYLMSRQAEQPASEEHYAQVNRAANGGVEYHQPYPAPYYGSSPHAGGAYLPQAQATWGYPAATQYGLYQGVSSAAPPPMYNATYAYSAQPPPRLQPRADSFKYAQQQQSTLPGPVAHALGTGSPQGSTRSAPAFVGHAKTVFLPRKESLAYSAQPAGSSPVPQPRHLGHSASPQHYYPSPPPSYPVHDRPAAASSPPPADDAGDKSAEQEGDSPAQTVLQRSHSHPLSMNPHHRFGQVGLPPVIVDPSDATQPVEGMQPIPRKSSLPLGSVPGAMEWRTLGNTNLQTAANKAMRPLTVDSGAPVSQLRPNPPVASAVTPKRDSGVERPRPQEIAENLDIFFPTGPRELIEKSLTRGLAHAGTPSQPPSLFGTTAHLAKRGRRVALTANGKVAIPPRTASTSASPRSPNEGDADPAAFPAAYFPHLRSSRPSRSRTQSPMRTASPSRMAVPIATAGDDDPVPEFKALNLASPVPDLAYFDAQQQGRMTPLSRRAGTPVPQIITANLPTDPYPHSGSADEADTESRKPSFDMSMAVRKGRSSRRGSRSASRTRTPDPMRGRDNASPHRQASPLDGDEASIPWIKGELIGMGSFGRVYLGLAVATGEMMAVKQVELPVSTGAISKKQASMLEALQREIELLRDLSHPNIVHYLGFERAKNTLNVFLEYVSGGSVASLLASVGRALPEPLSAMFTAQIVAGVAYLHECGILHRDLKCANVLVTEEGVCKISDFGLSKRMGPFAEPGGDGRGGAGGLGAYDFFSQHSLQGSIYWMAPEVVRERGYSAKVDIWSIGCLCIEMVTGNRPWVGLNEFAAIYRLGTDSKPDIPAWVSVEARTFCDACFTIDPDQRPTAQELLAHPYVLHADMSYDYKSFLEAIGSGPSGEEGGT